MNYFLIVLGKLLSNLVRKLNLGNGSTWPGHIALQFNKNFITDVLSQSSAKTILVTGTNGKTTTAKLIETILTDNGREVYSNISGANLLNGIASVLIEKSQGGEIKADYLIFEVDENVVPLIPFSPDYIVALNLFRDQLDRYGEIDTISRNWAKAYKAFTNAAFILNTDDPQIFNLAKGLNEKKLFFGLTGKTESLSLEHAADSTICPNCGSNLTYEEIYYSHLGRWSCKKCGLYPNKSDIADLEDYPLPGIYNRYNTLAAVLLTKELGIPFEKILTSIKNFTPAFGRQEELKINNKTVKFFLAKNPTGFNESLRTISKLGAKKVLIVLNDRIPDGTDISWIWDVDFEMLHPGIEISVSGDRVYDLALRFKYAQINCVIYDELEEAIGNNLEQLKEKEILYILPTYSAMLEARKIITGKKIL